MAMVAGVAYRAPGGGGGGGDLPTPDTKPIYCKLMTA